MPPLVIAGRHVRGDGSEMSQSWFVPDRPCGVSCERAMVIRRGIHFLAVMALCVACARILGSETTVAVCALPLTRLRSLLLSL